MTGKFTKGDLEDMFRKIGKRLPKKVEAFLLGGGAMCFRNQKNATKDLDLVFKDLNSFNAFASAIAKLGFAKPKKVETEYKEMEASGIWENRDGFRLDLFVGKVCGALELSERMAARSEPLGTYGNMAVKMASNEDVILFKGITERIDDANDIAAIIRTSSIKWDVVLAECAAQSKARAWYGSLYNKMVELEEMHKITVPIARKLKKLDNAEILREAYATRINSGLSRKAAVDELIKIGFTKKEIEKGIRT
jgi:hypothetical protein